jgi:hypothetical protein
MANFNLDKYITVNERISKFYKDNPDGRILTKLVHLDGPDVKGRMAIIKASIYLGDLLVATGYAKEREGSYGANKTAFIENCETSAVGRALALFGMEVEKGIASREEMLNVKANEEEIANLLGQIKTLAYESQDEEVQAKVKADWHSLKEKSTVFDLRDYYTAMCADLGIEPDMDWS